MGDKSTAKSTMQSVGVPTVPGSEGLLSSTSQAAALAEEMGYPVMIKATAGGGGRGMRLVPDASQLDSLYKAAQGEAEAAFGNPGLYMEKFIDRPRHVEVQVLADRHGNVVHLGERGLLDSAPSPETAGGGPQPGPGSRPAPPAWAKPTLLPPEASITRAPERWNSCWNRSGGFYFMEMNTRIQVEHPVTEMVTGVDLIAEQLRIAGGEPISVCQEDIQLTGHAIECRINAEDARHNFRPAPGRITGWLPPGGPGVRVDSHVYTGYDIPPFYDSLIGKLIVWGKDRDHAMTRMKRALNECAVTGIPTTVEFHLEMLDRPEFINGDVHTKFVEQEMLP